jgi:hypothetical protein
VSNFSIIRSSKLKAENIAKAHGHNKRSIQVKNANSDAQHLNQTLISSGSDLHADVLTHVKNNAPRAQVRKTSVLAQEIILTASPAYFRPSCPEKSGFYEEHLMEAWKKETFDFLKNRYKKNLISCELHLDEATPHIHAIVVPITSDGRLSAREVFDRKELTDYQTDYASSVAHLGLTRGAVNSKAEHKAIKDYYRDVNSPTPPIPTIEVPKNKLTKKSHQKWSEEQNKTVGESVTAIHNKATQADFWKKRAENEILSRIETEKRIDEMKRTTERIKDLDLGLVLEKLGFIKDLEKHKKTDKKTQYRQGKTEGNKYFGDRISVDLNRSFWMDHSNNIGGKGSVDLVIHINCCDFKNAKSWLIKEFGIYEATGAVISKTVTEIQVDERSNSVTSAPPVSVVKNIHKVRDYLVNIRKIDPVVIDHLITSGRLYADQRNNCCFVYGNLKKIEGVEQRGTVPGRKYNRFMGEKNVTFKAPQYSSEIKKIVVVESAIEALSYNELYRDSGYLVVSITGSGNGKFMKQITDYAKKENIEVIIALNNDIPGRKAAKSLVNICKLEDLNVIRILPVEEGVDWNDILKEIKIDITDNGDEVTNELVQLKYQAIVNYYNEKNNGDSDDSDSINAPS